MKKKVSIIHYHYIKGGVTSVIKNISNSLFREYEIHLYGSKKMGIDGIQDLLNKENIKFHDVPELKYLYKNELTQESFYSYKSEIKNYLLNYIDFDSIIWVHNYNLGKNPPFTEAIIELALEKDLKILFQIHDFPECGRINNLSFLNKYISNSLYPVDKNIYYITINKGDLKRLLQAGIPETKIFYLPNAINTKKENFKKQEERKKIINKVEDRCLIRKDDLLLLYPVRTIRRKNILEAALINIIVEKSFLFVTLPSNSRKEKKYEKIVKDVFKNNKIRGIWSVSKKYKGIYNNLIRGCDLFFSSSVLEGFGLIFLESKKYNKNFYVREIDIVQDFKNIPKYSYYSSLNIKLDDRMKDDVIKKYKNYLNMIDLNKRGKEILKEDIYKKIDKNIVDFSYLDVENQRKILNKENFAEIKELNSDIEKNIRKLSNGYLKQGVELGNFSLKKNTQRIKDIVMKIKEDNEAVKKQRDKKIDKSILESFLKIEYYRLLLNY